MVSRDLTNYEMKRPPLEQKLHLARWALHRCRRFTAGAPTIHIHLPEPAQVMVMHDKMHHLKLQALLIDLASYGATFGEGDSMQQLWVEALEGVSRDMKAPSEENIDLPTFTHQPKSITYPATSRPLPQRILNAPHATAFFDGGAA
jgi:hypothetical protein